MVYFLNCASLEVLQAVQRVDVGQHTCHNDVRVGPLPDHDAAIFFEPHRYLTLGIGAAGN